MEINTKKGFAPIVLLIITALLLLGGATVYLTQTDEIVSSNETISQDEKQVEVNSSTTTPTIDFAFELEKIKKELEEEREKRKELEGKVAQGTTKIVVQETQPSSSGISQELLKKIMARVVPVTCMGSKGKFKGSGTTQLVENNEMIVVTNFHVINVGPINSTVCTIHIPEPPNYTKGTLYTARRGKFSPYYPDVDVALLHISKKVAEESNLFEPFPLLGCSASQVNIGEKMIVLGYPSFGEDINTGENTLTVTDGTISGILPTQYGPRYKTSAKMDHGVSGGLAISTEHNCIIGVPTWGQYNYSVLQDYGVGEVLGQIQSWESIINYGEIF
jgi:hypothetical protein